MPFYEYRDKKTGELVEMYRPLALRDNVPSNLERIEVPSRLGCIRGLESDQGAAVKVPKALRQLEQGKTGAREIARHFGMSVDTIKRAWAMGLAGLCVFSWFSVRAADLTRGTTLYDGQRVSATQLHDLVDKAVINPGFISGKTTESSPSAGEFILLYSVGANTLYKATLGTAALNNPALISGQPAATGIGSNDTLLLLSGTNLYSFPASALLTNAAAMPGLMTNWTAITALSNADTLLVWSVGTNAGHGTNPTIGTVSVSTLAAMANPPKFSKTWSLNPSSGAIFNTAHGLPGTPNMVSWRLVCISASGGFQLADEVDLHSIHFRNTAGTNFLPCLMANPTTVSASLPVFNSLWTTTNGGSGVETLVSAGNFYVQVKAWYFP